MQRLYLVIGLTALSLVIGCSSGGKGPASKQERAAERMIAASEGHLAPVYGPLAEQIVRDYDLKRAEGVGLDIGSGPGTLIVELCKRTQMHWINVDINPHFFGYFLDRAAEAGCSCCVSAVQADVHHLPFRDGYAQMIVSRGSYRFWNDKVRAFSEIHRVLRPGGVAFIGRGLPRDFPLKLAGKVRSGHPMNYDPQQKAAELQSIMRQLGIEDYRIIVPDKGKAEGINYGVWIEFRK